VRTLRILHKWLGLIVGLQILLWTVSGFMFAWLDHNEVSAEHDAHAPPRMALKFSDPVVEPNAWLAEYQPSHVLDVTLMPLLDHWVYRIRLKDRVELRRADDGKRFEIDAAMIRRLSAAHYAGDAALRGIRLHAESTVEARKAGAVWQASYADAKRTSLYFSAADGRLVATRNDTWRLFDIFWMLHTMDYRGRDNFNNPLVILAATGALWLGISGGLLLFRAFRPGELNPFARYSARSAVKKGPQG
jgi:Na+-transporting NADH:ubiquinone oxidoreductase subunit F